VVLTVCAPEETTPEQPTPTVNPQESPYLIGVGRADCTGPVADLPMVSFISFQFFYAQLISLY